MSALRLLAGPKAYQRIKEEGLRPELFTQLMAASGGPKWIGVAGLDKYLFGEFFKEREQPLYTLGASSGAWRLSCFAQNNPLDAYKRFETLYIEQRYKTKPSPEQVSRQVGGIIQGMLGEEGAKQIIHHPWVKTHLIACRGKHLNTSHSKFGVAAGLAATAASNLIGRKALAWHFERYIFATHSLSSPYVGFTDLPSKSVALTQENLAQVMLATGSIPLVLAPVTQISGVDDGYYYDGGITDYHFDFALPKAQGLTLYPHFYPHITPGWFDKSLKWRRAKHNYDNALILAPSAEFVANLPHSKLPDREDFSVLDSDTRIRDWYSALGESERLGDELACLVDKPDAFSCIEPLY